jgi:hypothetical protein
MKPDKSLTAKVAKDIAKFAKDLPGQIASFVLSLRKSFAHLCGKK